MLLRHPISRRGFLLGTSFAVSHVLPSDVKSDPRPSPDTGEFKPAPATMLSSVEDYGVTWTFNEPQPVAFSCLGDPMVVLQSGAQVVATDPPATAKDGGYADGTVFTPFQVQGVPSGSQTQGFDPEYGWRGSKSHFHMGYDPSLNIDPAKTNPPTPIPLQAGTYVKAKLDYTHGEDSAVSSYSYLPVSAYQPPAGFFRPGPSALNPVALYCENMLNYDVLRKLAPVSGQPSMSNVLSQNLINPRRGRFGWRPNPARRMDNDVQPDYLDRTSANSRGTYPAAQARERLAGFYALHLDLPDSEKRTVMLRLIQDGLDRIAEYDRGWRGSSGMGQHHGYLFPCYLAAFALGSQELLEKAQGIRAGMTRQFGWIEEGDIGYMPRWPTHTPSGAGGDTRRWNGWIEPEFLGMPVHAATNSKTQGNFAPYMTHRYNNDSSSANLGELMPILLLQNGPGGISGAEAFLGGEGGSNRATAAIALLDLYEQWRGIKLAHSLVSWARSCITTHRHLIDHPLPLGQPPLRFETASRSQTSSYLTAVSGGFTYSINGTKWTRPETPVTRQDIRYSQDGVHFIELHDVPTTDTITGLTVSEHLVQVRNWNVNGHRGWSVNYQYNDQNTSSQQGNRMAITPSGTPADAPPVQVEPPLMYVSRVPGTLQPDYEPAPPILTPDQYVIVAGAGYFSGHPAPQRQYRKKRDGVVVGTGTWRNSPRFAIEQADLGSPISIEIRVHNTINGVVNEVITETNAVLYPERPALGPDLHFHSSFDASFELWYPEVLASAVTGGGNPDFDQNETHPTSIKADPWFDPEEADDDGEGDDPEEEPDYLSPAGWVFVAHNSSRPRHCINLAARKPLTPGTYILEMDIPVVKRGTSGATAEIALLRQSYNGRDSGVIASRAYDGHGIVNLGTSTRVNRIKREITVVEGQTALWVYQLNGTGTNNSNTGRPGISWARLYRKPV